MSEADPQFAPESDLIAGVAAGDERVIAQFVRQHGGWMRVVAERLLRDPVLAEDCVQDALINAIRKIETFAGRASLRTWLHRIVVNSALMKLRTRRRLNESPIDDLLPVFDGNACRIEPPWQEIETPERIVARAQASDLIMNAISELPEDYRIALMLRDIEELSTREVAELLDCTENTVKVRLHRARAALKTRLEPLLRGEMLT
ncbi:MAG: RNA polymerase sigma factor [Hyphomicrobiaceae bacterium]